MPDIHSTVFHGLGSMALTFALLVWSARMPEATGRRVGRGWPVVGGVILLGVLVELVQLWILHAGAAWNDLVLDMMGAFLGWAAWYDLHPRGPHRTRGSLDSLDA